MGKLDDILKQMEEAGIKISDEERAQFEARIAEQEAEDGTKALRNVWMAMHFYMDETSTWNNVMGDAKDERKVREDNVKIFAHKHSYVDDCNKNCKEY